MAENSGPPSSIFTISPPPANLYRIHPEAYDPELVSIGPLHWGHQKFPLMKKHKDRLFTNFLIRTTNLPGYEYNQMIQILIDRCLKQLSLDKARGCYGDEISLDLDKFSEIMFIDACFILELFYLAQTGEKVDDPIWKSRWMLRELRMDLIKLGNQLPFFLLEELHQLSPLKETSLLRLAANFFAPLAPGSQNPVKDKLETRPCHLLDLFHSTFNPIPTTDTNSDDANSTETNLTIPNFVAPFVPAFRDLLVCFHLPVNPIPPLNGTTNDRTINNCNSFGHIPPQTETNDDTSKTISHRGSVGSVGELKYHGIRIKKSTERETSFLKINWQNKGILELPPLSIQHNTISVFQNLVAYEQCNSSVPTYFTSYAMFMNELVSSPDEVRRLCRKGILTHALDDEQVVKALKTICKDAACYEANCYLFELIQKINHRKTKVFYKLLSRFIIFLWLKPYRILTLIFAYMAVVFTFTQTLFVIIPFLTGSR